MRTCDCKVINSMVGHAPVKVMVEMMEPNFFQSDYKLKIKVTGGNTSWSMESDRDYIKGDYFLVRLAYENFGETEAKDFAERAWKRSQLT